MTNIIVPSQNRDTLAAQVLAELAAAKDRGEDRAVESKADPVKWIESNFYLGSTGQLVKLAPHQKCILRLALSRNKQGRFPYRAFVYSSIKKSGKSAIAGMIARWMAETQTRYSEIFCIGNDLTQARDRSFREVRESLESDPRYNRQRQQIPGKWGLKSALTMTCTQTGTQIKAIAVDAKGEAGGKPAVTIWTELWGFEFDDALRFWDEMTPVPTVPDSFRLVETYAGYDGESTLLYGLYEMGLKGRQLTAHDLALAGQSDSPGESYEELLHAFKETDGEPTAKVPVWVNPNSSLFMYWDSGLNARRMPWQMGPEGEEYYRAEEAILPANTFRRIHLNEWVGAESQYVPIEAWDACYNPTEVMPLLEGDKTPIVLSVDAATTHDCFAIVAVSRHPTSREEVVVRAARKWDPAEEGGFVTYAEPEAFLRECCAKYNVIQITYDAFQLVDMMQRLVREGIAWCEPFSQAQERSRADRQLYDLIIHRRLHHREDAMGRAPMREHLLNSNAKLQKDQDSTLRIVKKTSNRKIDLAVAMSMGVARCLYLWL